MFLGFSGMPVEEVYRMTKILVLSPKPPWTPGGVEKVVKETAIRVSREYNTYVEVWCLGAEDKTVYWEGIKVRVFKALPLGFSLKMIKELKRVQDSFDVIHIHGTSNLYPIKALLSIDNWKKVIVSSHYHPMGSNLLFRLTKPFYDAVVVSRYLHKANRIICVSNTEKNTLLTKFNLPVHKLKVIYNGVDLNKIRSFKQKRRKEKGKVIILYFGRLEKYKNVHVVIEALKYLPETFVFYIVGRGPYEGELRKLVHKLNLEDRVKFLGFLPEDELYALLHSVDIVVNLSDIEAFGIMVVESLAAGKPVIVNNKGGLKELAGYFSLCVSPVNDAEPKKVKDAILSLFKCLPLKIKKCKAKIRIMGWDTLAMRYAQVMRGCINGN